MKNLLIVIGIFAGALILANWNKGDYSILPALSEFPGEQTQLYEIDDLFDVRKPFERMAETGAYTIIEVYSDHCGRCKIIEAQFPKFLASRDDVVIKRVRVFSGRISFDSEEEYNRFVDRQENIMAFYQMEGTPHIEIYDGVGRPLARDRFSKKSGLGLLQELLKGSS